MWFWTWKVLGIRKRQVYIWSNWWKELWLHVRRCQMPSNTRFFQCPTFQKCHSQTGLTIGEETAQKWFPAETVPVWFRTVPTNAWLSLASDWLCHYPWLTNLGYPAQNLKLFACYSVDRDIYICGDFHKCGIPKWLVYNGKSYSNGWLKGATISGISRIRKPPYIYILFTI